MAPPLILSAATTAPGYHRAAEVAEPWVTGGNALIEVVPGAEIGYTLGNAGPCAADILVIDIMSTALWTLSQSDLEPQPGRRRQLWQESSGVLAWDKQWPLHPPLAPLGPISFGSSEIRDRAAWNSPTENSVPYPHGPGPAGWWKHWTLVRCVARQPFLLNGNT